MCVQVWGEQRRRCPLNRVGVVDLGWSLKAGKERGAPKEEEEEAGEETRRHWWASDKGGWRGLSQIEGNKDGRGLWGLRVAVEGEPS